MSFDFTISIIDIISILTIALTFITVLQVKQQRSDALNPYIAIRSCEKVFRFDCKNGNLNDNPQINLSNIGSDLAKNINIEFSICNVPNELLSKSIQITKNTCFINEQKLILLHRSINFSYCETKENLELGNHLRGYIETFCHIYKDVYLSNRFTEYHTNVAKIFIKISYFNILGKKHNKYMALFIDPVVISSDEILFYIKTHELSKKEYQKNVTKKYSKQNSSSR